MNVSGPIDASRSASLAIPIRTRGFMLRLHCFSTRKLVTATGFLLLGLAPAFAAVNLTGGGNHGAEMKQIEQLENQWRDAILASDTATVASMLADDYVGIGPNGTISTKAEDLAARSSGQQTYARLELEDRKIRIFGTTAVVTSKVKVQGTYGGMPLLGEYRYTRVWDLSHGQWHIVSFEANRIHDSTARRK